MPSYASQLREIVLNGIPVIDPQHPTALDAPTFALSDAQLLEWGKGDYPTGGDSNTVIVRSLTYDAYVGWMQGEGTGVNNREGRLQELLDEAHWSFQTGNGTAPPAHPGNAAVTGARQLLRWMDPMFWQTFDLETGRPLPEVIVDRIAAAIMKVQPAKGFTTDDRDSLTGLGNQSIAPIGAKKDDGAAVLLGLLPTVKDDTSMLAEYAAARAI